MGKRPKKKIVLFLVEGKSDREALQLAISELYDEIDDGIEVYFPIIRKEKEEKGGDITSTNYIDKQGRKRWVNPSNIEDAIYTMFLADFFDKEKILPKDITEIIQIVDTDGVYIPDECVVRDINLSEEESPYYDDEKIACLNVDGIIKRNQQKCQNLNYLSSCSTIKVKQKKVPYSVYFFSCNLDHFIHHSRNLDYKNKIHLADVFSKKFMGKAKEFIKEIINDPGTLKDVSYEESWDYIKQKNNSLHRRTNINLLFLKLLNKVDE